MGNCGDVMLPNNYEINTKEVPNRRISGSIQNAMRMTKTLQVNSDKMRESASKDSIKCVPVNKNIGKTELVKVSKIQNVVRGHLYRKRISGPLKSIEEAVQETRTFRSGDNLIEGNNSGSNSDIGNSKARVSKLNESDLMRANSDTRHCSPEGEQEKIPIVHKGDTKLGPFQTYKGGYKSSKKHGYGIYRLKDNAIYEGYFENDKASGFGILSHSNGDVYTGQWNSNRSNGIGRYTSLAGAYYEGFWILDKREDFGIEKLQTGNLYCGEYKDGYKNGIGVLTLEDQSTYTGEFVDNDISGIGTYRFSDERVYQGEWLNNKMHGYGVITWPDQKRFEGYFEKDKKEGFGIYYANSKIYIGVWSNSKLNGEVMIIHNGSARKSLWQDGVKIKTLPKKYAIYFEKIAIEILDNSNN